MTMPNFSAPEVMEQPGSEVIEQLFQPLITSPAEQKQQPESPHQQEILPHHEKVLVKIETSSLRDGVEVEKKIWEPLLGGELYKLWNEILVSDGDEVVIKGSTVLKMVFGGYVYDPEKGTAAKTLRSDIDVVATSPEMEERIRNSKFYSGTTTLSTKLNVEGIEVGMVSQEEIRRMNLEAIEEIRAWTLQNHVYNQKQILYMTEVAKDIIEKAGPAELLMLDNFYKHEEIGIRLVKDNNEIKAYLLDHMHCLEEPDTDLEILAAHYAGYDTVRTQLDKREQSKIYNTIVFGNPNLFSTQSFLMEILTQMENGKFSNKQALYALNAIPRMIIGACENGIVLAGPGDPRFFYYEIAKVAKRMADGEEIFTVPETVFSKEDREKGIDNVNTWFRRKVQTAFARSCVSNMEDAYCYAFMNLPLGNLISKDLGNYFEEYHQIFPPNNIMAVLLGGVTPEDLPIKTVYGEIPDIPTIRSALDYFKLVEVLYGMELVPMKSLKALGQEDQENGGPPERPTYYPDYIHRPKNMSEVMALVLVSVGWDPEANETEIRNLISNWMPNGKIKGMWRTEEVDFDTSLDENIIKENMQMCKIVLDMSRGHEHKKIGQ